MLGADPRSLVALTVLSVCAGAVFVATGTFSYVFVRTRDRLDRAVLIFGLLTLVALLAEIAVGLCYLQNHLDAARQAHRIRGLALTGFVVLIPELLGRLLSLRPWWRRVNRMLVLTGLVFVVASVVVAFVQPPLFSGMTPPRAGCVIVPLWRGGRGDPGVFLVVRDAWILALAFYGIAALAWEMLSHKVRRDLVFPLVGVVVALLASIFDIVHAYSGHGTSSSEPHEEILLSVPGATLFFLLATAGVLRRHVVRLRELQAAHRIDSLGLLAGGIAHDFNNLLMAVTGNLALAREAASVETDTHVRRLLDDAACAATRARGLTRQLLTFAKGGAPVLGVADLQQIVTDTAEFVLHGSRVRCQYAFADGLPPVNVDVGQFSQVVHNLVLNAVEAMPDGGRLRITGDVLPSLPPAAGAASRRGPYVRVSVHDDGPGISAAHIERVFDPFFTTKTNGTGLGLAIAYSIIRKHGGSMTVAAGVEGGTVFDVYLPAGTQSAATAEEPSAVPQETARGRALLLDDEDLVRRTGERMLQRVGFDADCVADGRHALARYKAALEEGRPYAFVLLDLTLPGGWSGEETLRQILAIDPSVIAIASSGYTETESMAQPRSHGFAAALPKPYGLDDLRQAIALVLNGDDSSEE